MELGIAVHPSFPRFGPFLKTWYLITPCPLLAQNPNFYCFLLMAILRHLSFSALSIKTFTDVLIFGFLGLKKSADILFPC